MKPVVVPMLVLALASTAPPSLAAAKARPAKPATVRKASPPGSFIPYAAGSLPELFRQLNNSPKLRERYAKHFGIKPEQVIPAFRNGLKEARLTKPQRSQVWFRSASGKRTSKRSLIPKGSLVFVTKAGVPVLKGTCGNPFLARLPVTPKEKPPIARVLTRVQERRREFDVTTPFETPEDVLIAEVPSELPLWTSLASVPPSYVRSRNFMLLWWPSHDHPEIPEAPTTLLLLAGGVGLLPVLARMRKTANTQP